MSEKGIRMNLVMFISTFACVLVALIITEGKYKALHIEILTNK